MVRKFIVDCVKYWADEYHIDGFRFDLAGLIDVQTIHEAVCAVRRSHPHTVFYGEGWDMGTHLTKSGCALVTQRNAHLVPDFAFFCDDMRDGLRGSVFDDREKGFICGGGFEDTLRQCYMGLPHWSASPAQCINYASCHDNMTLFDRITHANPGVSEQIRIRMNCLAAAIYLTAQGVPFIMAGEEMLRSKPLGTGGFDHNSYRSPDSVNSIKWQRLSQPETAAVLRYYRGLIAFRKAYPRLWKYTQEQARHSVKPVCDPEDGLLAFHIGEDWLAFFHANSTARPVTLPEGLWHVYVDGERASVTPLYSLETGTVLAPISALILRRA